MLTSVVGHIEVCYVTFVLIFVAIFAMWKTNPR